MRREVERGEVWLVNVFFAVKLSIITDDDVDKDYLKLRKHKNSRFYEFCLKMRFTTLALLLSRQGISLYCSNTLDLKVGGRLKFFWI